MSKYNYGEACENCEDGGQFSCPLCPVFQMMCALEEAMDIDDSLIREFE